MNLKALTLQYHRFTLGPMDLDLEAGRVVGLVGPNGSGKTTTLRCISGNLYPDSGEIIVWGRRARPDDGSWKAVTGFVPDRPQFFEEMKVGSFLDLLSHFYPRWSWDEARSLSGRFDLNLEARLKHLSQGNRTKVSLVGALAHHPRLILLDEPMASIDPVVRTEIFEVLWERMERDALTIFYSTHIVDDLHRFADELVFLKQGRIQLQASKDELIDRWRRIRFCFDGALDLPEGVISGNCEGADHEWISREGERTRARLSELGATRIRSEALTLEEISVRIMKGNRACLQEDRSPLG